MNVFEIIVTIASIIAAIGIPLSLFSLKRYIENLIADEKAQIKPALEAYLNSEAGQKAIYSIGVLLGNAVASGVGIQKKSGKFNLQDLIMQGAASFLGFKLPGQTQEGQQPQSLRRQENIPEA